MPRETPRAPGHTCLTTEVVSLGVSNAFECKAKSLSFGIAANSREGHVRDSPAYIFMCPYIHICAHTYTGDEMVEQPGSEIKKDRQ